MYNLLFLTLYRRFGTIDNTALEYIISIDYIDYSLTVSTSASLSQISNELVDLIETSPRVGSATVTIFTTSSTIEIVGADPGIRFNIATNSPRLGRYSLTQPNISIKTGTVEVSGSISETLSLLVHLILAWVLMGYLKTIVLSFIQYLQVLRVPAK